MIDQGTIDRIFDAARIEDVVGDFVTLKRRGVNMIGLCPFHNEKTPSFIVSPAKGIFKCFGCGKGGNAVSFIMEQEGISFTEALKYLGKKYGIEVKDKELSADEIKQKNERESMLVVSAWAQETFTRQLHEHAEGKAIGLSYFRERGFRDDIIKKFQLGYSLEKRDALSQNAIKSGYKLEYLSKTGLTITGDNNYMADRFRGRVMFPIHSLAGKVIAFGGRTLKAGDKMAKYLNSPESEIYHKSRVLYGIYQAKTAIQRQDRCLLVEGYTDVLSLHQAAIENVVASSGTALTVDQIRLIKRFTNNITILYDGDPAGIKASLRGIDLVLEQGINVKVLLLPDGEDPDSFSRKMGSAELLEYIEKNQSDFINFKTNLLLEEASTDPVKRAHLISNIVQSIAIIPDGITRSVYIRECSTLLQIEEGVLYTEINKILYRRRQKRYEQKRYEQNRHHQHVAEPTPVYTSEPQTSISVPTSISIPEEERMLIRYLIKFGRHSLENEEFPDEKLQVDQFIIEELELDEMEPEYPIFSTIYHEYVNHLNEDNFNPQRFFLQHPDPHISAMATDLLANPHILSKIHSKMGRVESEEEKLVDLIPRGVLEFKSRRVRTLLQAQMEKLKNAKEEEVTEIMKKVQIFTQIQAQISKQLGNRTII